MVVVVVVVDGGCDMTSIPMNVDTYLLLVILGIGQQSRDVKHNLVPFVDGVDRIGSRHISCIHRKWIYRKQQKKKKKKNPAFLV